MAAAPGGARKSPRIDLKPAGSGRPNLVDQTVPVHNEDIAAAFEEMADLLSVRGDNAFRIRAYRRAAQSIRGQGQPLRDLRERERLRALPGIGADLAGKIGELLDTGHLEALDRLRTQIPTGVRGLLALPGLGPVRGAQPAQRSRGPGSR